MNDSRARRLVRTRLLLVFGGHGSRSQANEGGRRRRSRRPWRRVAFAALWALATALIVYAAVRV